MKEVVRLDIEPAAIAQEINERHARMNALAKDAVANAIRIAELLCEQRKLCKHGDWLPWLKANVQFSQKTAHTYMRVYAHRSKLEVTSNIAEAYRLTLPKTTAKTNRSKPHVRKSRPSSDDGLTNRGQQVFGEVDELRAENGKLKSDILKLNAALQEEPDAAKLRQKVVDQQVEIAAMRRTMKEIAQERDEYKRRATPSHREAERLLTSSTYRTLIKALHSDRGQHVSDDELKEAERLAVALRPLFIHPGETS
jgi:hypothetical protein